MTQQYPPMPPPQQQQPAQQKRRRAIPLWVFIVALAVTMFASCGVGAGIGSSGSSEPTAASDTFDLEQREKNVDAQQEDLNALRTELLERDKALDDREAELDKREKALAKKEQKKAEQEAANTIPGEGVYVVGQDVKPGTYSTAGPSGSNPVGCYYAFKSGTEADAEIIDNNIINGRGTVTLEDGQIFETQGCEQWKRR